MKKLMISSLFVLAMMFGLMTSTATVSAQGTTQAQVSATKAQKARSKYSTFVRKPEIISYKIIDMDGNGIPELLYFNKKTNRQVVSTYNANTGRMLTLCYCNSGKGYGMTYSVKYHKVALHFNTTGDNNYYVYKISGIKATRTGTYIAKRGSNRVWKRTINGKKVSDTVYWNKTAVLQKWTYLRGIF